MNMKLTKRFAVYVDSTLEESARPFYVGKGTEERVNDFSDPARNGLHGHISRDLGLQREIVFETDDEEEAYARETALVGELHTYAHGGEGWWGANLDMGGRGGGSIPKDDNWKAAIQTALKGRSFSDEHRRAISEGSKGKVLSEVHRRHISEANLSKNDTPERAAQRSSSASKSNRTRWSKPLSDEARQKISDAAKKRAARQRAEGLKRKPTSEATKEKLRLAHQRRKASLQAQASVEVSFAETSSVEAASGSCQAVTSALNK